MVNLVGYFVGDKVKIELLDGKYFKGVILSISQDEVTISDIHNNRVSLSSNNIAIIQGIAEVQR